MDRSKCSTYQIDGPHAGPWSFRSLCALAHGTTVSTVGSMRGDFETSYAIDATGTTSGARDERLNATHRVTIAAKWLGPCLPDMKGGDVMTEGKIVNVFSNSQ
jgi:hypothetical protein